MRCLKCLEEITDLQPHMSAFFCEAIESNKWGKGLYRNWHLNCFDATDNSLIGELKPMKNKENNYK